MNSRPEIVFVFPAAMGGVASFNYNIINNCTQKGKFTIRVILLQAKEDTRPVFNDKYEADEVEKFSYSSKENQYFVAKRLENLIGKIDGAVVCDNALTIQACTIFKNPKTIFHLVHDYFYVNQNIAFGDCIDVAVAHSSFFADCVFASNPRDYVNSVFYIPYGVLQYRECPVKSNPGKLKLVFLGRLDVGKGVDKLIAIEDRLIESNVEVDWTIIGQGPIEGAIKEAWKERKNIMFLKPHTTEEVYQALIDKDIFVFPTSFEGTPVSILEAMSNAVAVVVSDLPGGIRDIVNERVGFRVGVNDVEQFTDRIRLLHSDRILLERMQMEAWKHARDNYDISKNADSYFDLFSNYGDLKRQRACEQVIGFSRLDRKEIPNAIVKYIRSLR